MKCDDCKYREETSMSDMVCAPTFMGESPRFYICGHGSGLMTICELEDKGYDFDKCKMYKKKNNLDDCG